MHSFTLGARCVNPFPHGLSLKTEGGFDRRNGTARTNQGDDTGDGWLISTPTKERCASARTERLATELTLEAWAGLAMPTNVALAGLPSCRAIQIGAEYVWRMHRLLLVFGDTQDIVDTFATFSSAGGQATV
jgi:hypothetical protein